LHRGLGIELGEARDDVLHPLDAVVGESPQGEGGSGLCPRRLQQGAGARTECRRCRDGAAGAAKKSAPVHRALRCCSVTLQGRTPYSVGIGLTSTGVVALARLAMLRLSRGETRPPFLYSWDSVPEV